MLKKTGKRDKMIKDLSDIKNYLRAAGYITHADKIQEVMDAIDGNFANDEDYLLDPFLIPDNQRNIENQGFGGGESPIGGGYGMLGVDEAMRAEDGWGDKKKLFDNEQIYFESSMGRDLLFSIMGSYPKSGPNETGEGYRYFICVESSDDSGWYYCFGTDYPTYKDAKNSVLFFSKNINRDMIEKSDSWGKMNIDGIEQDNVDIAMSNGLQGNTAIDRGMFSGFSDSYFYRGVGSIEDNM
jgi:hypothetical protein